MGKINASDKIMSKYQKKRENMEIKEIFTYPSIRLFWNGIHSFLRRWADARGSADIIYHIWCISL